MGPSIPDEHDGDRNQEADRQERPCQQQQQDDRVHQELDASARDLASRWNVLIGVPGTSFGRSWFEFTELPTGQPY